MTLPRWLIVVMTVFGLFGCSGSGSYHEEETGYKGQALVDPWLAAGRFLSSYGHEVSKPSSWHPPTPEETVWFVPAKVIGNETFARQMEGWMNRGGHLVCLVDYTDPGNDWWLGSRVQMEPAFEKMLSWHGFSVAQDGSATAPSDPLRFRGRKYDTEAKSDWQVSVRNAKSGVFASTVVGNGRLTVITDARIFRNRWIDGKQHAELLKALVDASSTRGTIVFVRGATLSLWALLWERAWALMVGMILVLAVWLWKNLPRFGPVEAADAPSPLRGYDHHLEALGDFQWRLDKGAAMLAPIREAVIERSQRMLIRTGRQDADIFAVLAERAGISRERAQRALVETAPADAAVFTRTVADLQAILRNLD
ncbi:hypothetical protein KBB96_01765 [Luteolibacter ambystomatis]|uniref:DUF4350 domain-containing protein n=1 Tax=Luteolibacter ambystomatis TaxID=2824561 RepID=A0A975J087_9BACT|nr:DUF4350 domain-containing protein [Luteolibacter ambystomatis]QUE51632.1 hypothetical protein KBB96_01765 [Luteolibacter ambystomatis]